MGSTAYLVQDLSLPCEGSRYTAATIVNVVYVVVVVLGWPAFLVWYLRKIAMAGRKSHERVRDRIGFLYSSYRDEYLYWDALVFFFFHTFRILISCDALVRFQ